MSAQQQEKCIRLEGLSEPEARLVRDKLRKIGISDDAIVSE